MLAPAGPYQVGMLIPLLRSTTTTTHAGTPLGDYMFNGVEWADPVCSCMTCKTCMTLTLT